jgi:hypothetical protein
VGLPWPLLSFHGSSGCSFLQFHCALALSSAPGKCRALLSGIAIQFLLPPLEDMSISPFFFYERILILF